MGVPRRQNKNKHRPKKMFSGGAFCTRFDPRLTTDTSCLAGTAVPDILSIG
ncbi:unnamed protein product [Ectocarpus sp. CCAP 1310/34]|nr:unnamed protein product [Ectocarpus sp. CCAP 1310/34]